MSNAKIILQGDIDGATQYIATAMYYLKLVRMEGRASTNKSFPIDPKVDIRVVLNPHTGDRVYIRARACPAVAFSGLVDTFKAAVATTPRYLIDAQLKEEFRLPLNPKEPFPQSGLLCGVRPLNQEDVIVSAGTGEGAPANRSGNDGDLYVDSLTDDVYRKELAVWGLLAQDIDSLPSVTNLLPSETTLASEDDNGATVTTVGESLFKKTYERLPPTKFTGLMRRVVQATFATEAWRGFAPTTTPEPAPAVAPINYQYGNSWGCVLHNKKYYFIEIGVQEVYAVPADYCLHKAKIKGVDTDVVILNSVDTENKVKIGVIPSDIGSSWSTEIGWAFSYDKTEAAIVFKDNTDVGQETYVTTSLLKLVFTFDEKDALTTATLIRTPPSIFYHPVFMNKSYETGGHALFNPVTRVGDAVINYTEDFGLQRLLFPSPPNYSANDIPVYVYYIEGGIQLCTYSYQTVAGTNNTVPIPDLITRYQYNYTTGTYTLAISDSALRFQVGEWGTTIVGGYTRWGFSCAGSDIPEAKGGVANNTTSYRMGGRITQGGVLGDPSKNFHYTSYTYIITNPPADPLEVFGDSYIWVEDFKVNAVQGVSKVESGGAVVTNSVLTLSTTDREAALITSTKYTDAFTGTQTVLHGKASVYGSGAVTTGSNSGPEWGDVEAALRLNFRLRFNIDCGSNPTYSFGNASHGVVPGFNDGIGDCVDFGGFQENYSYREFYSNGPAVSVCGVTVYSDPRYQATIVTSTPNEAQDLAKAASNVTTWVRHSHNTVEVVGGPMANELTKPLQYRDSSIAYVFVQAAFDQDNYIEHKGDLETQLVANVGGTKYDVKHKLYGWLGVA